MNYFYTCDWMKTQLTKSSVFSSNNCKYKLMIPIDENKFSPNRKTTESLKKFIVDDKLNFFFRSSYNERKGIRELIKILEILFSLNKKYKKKFRLLSIGDSFFEKNSNHLDIEYYNLGTVVNDEDLADIYSISDLFISPSLEDVGPMMINEAIISGVPTIAFDIGVARDLIIENISGYIIKKDHYKAFAEKLSLYLNLSASEIVEMKKKSRKIGLECTSKDSHKKF